MHHDTCHHRRQPHRILFSERRTQSKECARGLTYHNRKLRNCLKGRQDVRQYLCTHKGSHFYGINICQCVHYYVYYNVLLGFSFVYHPIIRAYSIPSDKKCYIFWSNILYSCISWKSCTGQTSGQIFVVEGRGETKYAGHGIFQTSLHHMFLSIWDILLRDNCDSQSRIF